MEIQSIKNDNNPRNDQQSKSSGKNGRARQADAVRHRELVKLISTLNVGSQFAK